ncbi:hypothetical protein ACFYY2_07630 [Streptomyces sp. NPDC001822]|uniref:deoxynucleotide monophosphate kinase family protein n=1 Tax=Streptomyces sp. NPDC001822 TaxID=3364614 RepID=UPI0036AE3063
MTAPLIGIAGMARSGKDTAAGALLDLEWTRRAFADEVKAMLYAANPTLVDESYRAGLTTLRFEVDSYGWEEVKQMFPEVRRMLQDLGMKGRESLGEDVWVNALFEDAETWGPTVITDVRFPNEAHAIRDRGGLVVAIHRPDLTAIPEADHISENALDGYLFDDVIRNDGTTAVLRDRVMQLIPLVV